MYLTRTNPRTNVGMFDQFFNEFMNKWTDVDDDSVVWRPRIDVKETKDAYELYADLPGMKKEDINISMNDSVLTIKGERKVETGEKDEKNYHMERTYGSFYRSFSLPDKVKQDAISASYKDGVLKVTLTKAEETKPKQISIH